MDTDKKIRFIKNSNIKNDSKLFYLLELLYEKQISVEETRKICFNMGLFKEKNMELIETLSWIDFSNFK